MDLLTYLYKNYARMSSLDMASNDERIQEYYNAKEPLDILVKRLDQYADFVTAVREPVSETQLACITYGMVEETGQYP